MRLISSIVIPFLFLSSGLVGADQVLKYEPFVVEISGRLNKGKFEHPNGEWVGFYALKLEAPAEIEKDGVNKINVSEKGITEIQIYSTSSETRDKIDKLIGKKVMVKGTLFHSHTAWHVRPLVMSVSEVK